MTQISAIDLSGYSFTGKSAVYDFVSEFDSVKTFGKEVEFDLIRCPGGLRDLYAALVDDWSLIRSSESIKTFLRLVDNTKGDGSVLSRLFDTGQMYSKHFPGFKNISTNFVRQLSVGSYIGYWPFYLSSKNAYEIFFKKLLNKLGFNDFKGRVYLSRLSDEEFFNLASVYLNELFSSSVDKKHTHVALNNAIEPYNSTLIDGFNFPFKQVVIERDPRDVYLSASNSINKSVSEAVLGKDINDFVKRYKLQRENNRNSASLSKLIWFEDLVLNYEETAFDLIDFLELSPEDHVARKKYFDPEVSSSGVNAWRYSNDPNISVIEKELSCYFYAR